MPRRPRPNKRPPPRQLSFEGDEALPPVPVVPPRPKQPPPAPRPRPQPEPKPLPTVTVGGRDVPYRVIADWRRRRMTLQITADGEVIVRVRCLTPDDEVHQFVTRHSGWLLEQLDPAAAAARRRRRVADGRGTVEYELNRHRGRRRIAIFVHPRGVEVRAPLNAPNDEIERFVISKLDWIRDTLARCQANARPPRQYVDGERILFRGEPYALRCVSTAARGSTVQIEGAQLVVRTEGAPEAPPDPLRVRRVLRHWLNAQALAIVRERIPQLAAQLGVRLHNVRIKDMQTRWGSCSTQGNISISFRLVMAPPPVMEYLLVHEVCHMVHPNHSAEYWALVASLVPDHKAMSRWLREHAHELEL